MLEYYQKVAVVSLALILVTAVLAVLCGLKFYKTDSLLPPEKSIFPWRIVTSGDYLSGGPSAISVTEAASTIDFRYSVSDQAKYPFVRLFIAFDDMQGANDLINLLPYYKVSFKVRCSARNVLTFDLRTLDTSITDRSDPGSYRISSHWFHCNDAWSKINVDLRHMEVPIWWLEQYGAEVHDRSYRLDKVLALSFVASRHGPIGTSTRIRVSELKLHTYEWKYLIVFVILSLSLWGGFVFWLFRQHARHLAEGVQQKMLSDRPLLAYQQLSLESHKDREKRAVLEYLAKEYSNPELNLELLVRTLGVNRKKVNDILREELGYTFSAYVNKLRLTEAARLVAEEEGRNINEIALSVGYKNVTWFNKVFREEYGCSPRKFRTLQLNRHVGR